MSKETFRLIDYITKDPEKMCYNRNRCDSKSNSVYILINSVMSH